MHVYKFVCKHYWKDLVVVSLQLTLLCLNFTSGLISWKPFVIPIESYKYKRVYDISLVAMQ